MTADEKIFGGVPGIFRAIIRYAKFRENLGPVSINILEFMVNILIIALFFEIGGFIGIFLGLILIIFLISYTGIKISLYRQDGDEPLWIEIRKECENELESSGE